MSNVIITECKWILVWNETDGIVTTFMEHCGEVSSPSTIEVFDSEAEIVSRVSDLGYEMPEEA
jgi:hypothetical protein